MSFNHPPSGMTSTNWRCSSAQGAKKRKIWAIYRSPQSAIHSSKSGLLDALSLSLFLTKCFLPFHPAFFATVCVSCLKILSPLLQKRRVSASSSNIYFGRDRKIFKYSNVKFTDNSQRIQSWLEHWLMTVCNQHFSEEVPPSSSPLLYLPLTLFLMWVICKIEESAHG